MKKELKRLIPDEIEEELLSFMKRLRVEGKLSALIVRLSNQSTLPVIRNDLSENEIVAFLLSVIEEEQKGNLKQMDWEWIYQQVYEHKKARHKSGKELN